MNIADEQSGIAVDPDGAREAITGEQRLLRQLHAGDAHRCEELGLPWRRVVAHAKQSKLISAP